MYQILRKPRGEINQTGGAKEKEKLNLKGGNSLNEETDNKIEVL